MTAQPVDRVDPFVELRFNPTDLRPQDISRAGAFLGSPSEALEAALSVVRARVVAQAKAEIAGIANPTYGQILRIADLAWQAVFWKYRKISAPVLADAYIRAYRAADAGDVPMSVIYDLAERHAEKTGNYFHDSSREALGEGFNALVNRNIPAKAAADRVLDAYGLTPRQMRGYTSSKFDQPVSDLLTREPKAQARAYIDRSFTSRLRKLSDQEEHNIDQQAQQLAWMWLQDKGRLNERAEKMWLTARDERVCPICGPLHGKKVGVNEKFVTKEGEFWTPGIHPNCRCELRLIENKYQLEKRFDPHQPRGENGRWSGGQSQHRQLGTRLNEMKSPSAKVHQGEVIHRSAQAIGYLKEPRYLTTPIKHRDREMARLARGASAWSRNSRHVTTARHLSDPDNAYYAGKLKMSRTERSLKLLTRSVASAPANSPELYRGLTVAPEHLEELKPGSALDLPMSSFTEDRGFSESFARKWGPMIARSHAKREGREAPENTRPVVMVLQPKAQALNISPLVSERQAEWITRGSFTITDVGEDNGLTVVHLRQEKGSVSKVWDPTEHPRGGDPDNPGRFSRVAQRQRPRPVIRTEEPTIWESLEQPEEEEVLRLDSDVLTASPQYRRQPPLALDQPLKLDAPQLGLDQPAEALRLDQPEEALGLDRPEVLGLDRSEALAAPAEAPLRITHPQVEIPMPAPAPAPEAPFKLLHPDGRPFYVVVADAEHTGLDYSLTGQRASDSLEEARFQAATEREEYLDREWATRTHSGRTGVWARATAPDGERVIAMLTPAQLRIAMEDVSDEASVNQRFQDLQAHQHYQDDIKWLNAATRQPVDVGEVMSNAEIVRQQGLEPGDFAYRILEVTHGHKEYGETVLHSPHTWNLSGNFVESGAAPGTTYDGLGKNVEVTQVTPYG